MGKYTEQIKLKTKALKEKEAQKKLKEEKQKKEDEANFKELNDQIKSLFQEFEDELVDGKHIRYVNDEKTSVLKESLLFGSYLTHKLETKTIGIAPKFIIEAHVAKALIFFRTWGPYSQSVDSISALGDKIIERIAEINAGSKL